MRVKNALGLCSIYTYQGLLFGDEMRELYSAATGEHLEKGELIKRGERISNLAKLINVKEGFSRKDDKVPEAWLRPMETPEGRIAMTDYFETKELTREDVEKNLDDYYDERGWNIEKGIPSRRKAKELQLEKYLE